jgi:hypothetical protein
MNTSLTYLPGGLMIAIFIVMMLLMYARKISALLALPLMALLFSAVGICRYGEFFNLLEGYLGWESFVYLMRWLAMVLVLILILLLLIRFRVIPGAYGLAGCIIVLFLYVLMNANRLRPIASYEAVSGLVSTFSLKEIVNVVLHKGALYLHDAYTVAIFGGMLAILVREKKIAETFIKYAAELAGDKPFVVAMAMMIVSFILFTTLGGLGAIIMVGTIILPIMLSLGIPALVAAGIFLVGISAGGTFNPGNWALYRDALGVPVSEIQIFALLIIVLYIIVGGVFIFFNVMLSGRRKYWSIGLQEPEGEKRLRVRPIALLSPVVPIILVFRLENFARLFEYVEGKWVVLDVLISGFSKFAKFWDGNIGAWDFVPAFMFGLVFCAVTTWQKRDNIRVVTKAMIEGAESVMPAVLLMFGIGMLLQAVRHPDVSVHLSPLIEKFTPSSKLWYVLGFGICAPLALYRGPLNIWGLGLGIGALFMQAGLSSGLIMGVFMSVGAVQGVCDPTNTHNVWIANYVSEDVIKITKKLLPYIWVMSFFGLIVAAMMFSSGFK